MTKYIVFGNLEYEVVTMPDGTTQEVVATGDYDDKAGKIRIFCGYPYFPYSPEKPEFVIELTKGENEIEFENEDYYNSFVQSVTPYIMDGTITIFDSKEEMEKGAEEESSEDEVVEKETTTAKKASTKKATK